MSNEHNKLSIFQNSITVRKTLYKIVFWTIFNRSLCEIRIDFCPKTQKIECSHCRFNYINDFWMISKIWYHSGIWTHLRIFNLPKSTLFPIFPKLQKDSEHTGYQMKHIFCQFTFKSVLPRISHWISLQSDCFEKLTTAWALSWIELFSCITV